MPLQRFASHLAELQSSLRLQGSPPSIEPRTTLHLSSVPSQVREIGPSTRQSVAAVHALSYCSAKGLTTGSVGSITGLEQQTQKDNTTQTSQ